MMARLSFTSFLALLTIIFPLSARASKRGLPYNAISNILNFHGPNSQISWAYNWASIENAGFPSYFEFVPMLFNNAPGSLATWNANANAALAKGSKHLIAFNEPDGCGGGQTCISAQTAASVYKQYMMPFASRASLGAPAVTNGPSGIPWLKAFLAACAGCKIDFIPIHWYDSATNEGYFYWYMAEIYAAGGNRPLWITEFRGAGTTTQQVDFLKQVMPWLDNTPYIERYAWEMAGSGTGGLVDGSGNPNVLGKAFAYNSF